MENKKVLFYGAGEYAALIFRHAKRKSAEYGEPLAFIDGDVYKQGHQLFGLDIVSWETAKERFGEDFYIYVTANTNTAPNIIGFLLENNIPEERIINYEPVEKRLGCGSAETYLGVRPVGDTISYFACTAAGDNLEYMGHANRWTTDWTKAADGESITQGINYVREMSKKIEEGDVEKRHFRCINKRVQYFFKNHKIRNLSFTGSGPCNFRCCYCCLNDSYFEPVKFNEYAVFVDVFKQLEDGEYIDEDTVINMSNGEFTISRDGAQLMKLAGRYPVKIFTNAYRLSQEAVDALKESSMIFCSVDAGTKETFHQVKGVDGFERVSANLREYAKYGPISLKYILLDGKNDSQENLEGFFKLADEVATRVMLSRDFMDSSTRFSEQSLWFAAEFIKHFRKNGMLNMNINGFLRPGERELLVKYMEV